MPSAEEIIKVVGQSVAPSEKMYYGFLVTAADARPRHCLFLVICPTVHVVKCMDVKWLGCLIRHFWQTNGADSKIASKQRKSCIFSLPWFLFWFFWGVFFFHDRELFT